MSSPSDPDSPAAFAAHIRNALFKGFAIPIAILIFFALAPAWLDHNLHSAIANSISQSSRSAADKTQQLTTYARIDFAAVCGSTDADYQNLRSSLEKNGVCGRFHRLQWSLWLSVLLVAIMTGVTLATFALNRRAQRSRADLIASYRLAWQLSISAALAKVLLLIPLLAYGSYELSTLATEKYFPKLIIVIVLGGLIALWRGVAILLKRVPMEFPAPMSRAVTPQEAPELWSEVRAAATRLGTAPPDHILVGMDHNFYVTELAVNHHGGQAAGRTLYLSLPLMQQLAPDEVMAVVGHELGHFRGDDTRITREFYPLRWKANATLEAMAEAGWVGWTSVHALLFFHGSFGRTEQAMSREREFVADRAAAELTSTPAIANALVKIHVFTEAFFRSLGGGTGNPFTVPLADYVRTELMGNADFWGKLFEQTSPHPLDSHPSLRLRLEALGQPVDPESAKLVATTGTATAHARWFTGRESLFDGIQSEALEQIGRVRATTANYETPEGKQLLDQHFPEIIWQTRPFHLWLKMAICSIGVIFSAIMLFIVDGWEVKLLMAGFATVFTLPMIMLWRRHHGGEFVLRPDSLSYTGWLRPLRFADIENISASSEYSAITVTFHLKAKAPGLWRHSPFNWIHSRTVTLELGIIPGKSQETLETLARYISRQTS